MDIIKFDVYRGPNIGIYTKVNDEFVFVPNGFASSKSEKLAQYLQTDYIDSMLMHGQENSWDDHWKVYRTMEEAVDEGKVKQLGISNFYRLEDVVWAYDNARIKFSVVQNRFYADAGHDVQIRAL